MTTKSKVTEPAVPRQTLADVLFPGYEGCIFNVESPACGPCIVFIAQVGQNCFWPICIPDGIQLTEV